MGKEILTSLIITLFSVFFLAGCAAEGQDDTQLLSGLNNRILETVLENDESGDTVTAADVVIEQIVYGSFSKPEAKEALVVCSFLNTPHTGGLDRKAILIITVDSMDVTAYDELPADEVWVAALPMSNGQDRIIFSRESTWQGISTQELMYFYIQNGQWTETPIEEPEIGDNQFYFLSGDVLIVASVSELIDPSDITAILTWDQDAGKWIAEQPPEKLSEKEISFFNTEFFNGPSFNPNNILLSGEYDNPQAIDFFQLFYNGTGKTTYQITEEERAKLSELDSEAPYLDIVKVTTDDINAFLQEKLGMALEETQQTGLDSFYYLEEYNSYYLVHGDTNYNKCTVISGSWESDDTIRLLYEKENEEGQWIVTLQKSNDKYLFLSNSKK